MHQMALQEQHKAFMLVYGRLKKQQRRQARYANKMHKKYRYMLVTLYFIGSMRALESLTLSGNLFIGSSNRPHQ